MSVSCCSLKSCLGAFIGLIPWRMRRDGLLYPLSFLDGGIGVSNLSNLRLV